MVSLELENSLQHSPSLQRNLPFSSRCLLGARASLAGAGGGGHGPSELDAPADGGVPGTSPELEAPEVGDEEGMVGDGGCDIAKNVE